MKVNNILNTWKKIFSNWKYPFLAIVIAVAFYSLNVLIANWKSLIKFYSSLGFFGTLKFFITLFFGFKNLILFSSFVSLVIISILFGMLFSLIIYKTKLVNFKGSKKLGVVGSVGVFLGALIPGCVACGIGLATVLGLGAGALAFLPYDGLEISVLAILILGFTITKITKEMYVCKIPKKKLDITES